MKCVISLSILLFYVLEYSLCASTRSKMKDKTSLSLENQIFSKPVILDRTSQNILGQAIESERHTLRLRRAIRGRRPISRSSLGLRSSFGSGFGSSFGGGIASRSFGGAVAGGSLGGGFASRWTSSARTNALNSMRQRHLASLRRRQSMSHRRRSSFSSRRSRAPSRTRMRAIPRSRVDSFAQPRRPSLPSFSNTLMTGMMLDALDTPDVFDVL